mmetsp:Transcript_40883/g.98595  ORF Transcript_40883/g.98595 Transcript_40883/m.98595 type:complete len:137 (+) Transcript_40883:65-475(+)
MPWSFVGRKTTATKKRQGGRKHTSRPRNIGRSLVNAGVREMMKEMEQDIEAEKLAKSTVTLSKSKKVAPLPLPAVAAPPVAKKNPVAVSTKKKFAARKTKTAAKPLPTNVKNPIEMAIKQAIAERAAAAAARSASL